MSAGRKWPARLGWTLLAVLFALSAWRALTGRARPEREGDIVIRFAHFQLEGGLRDAFERIARAYEAQHPGVRIEQIAIPERIFQSWLKTQLFGGTAPDLIQVSRETPDDLLARYFAPLTDAVETPNPYNVDTPLATTPWRATFLDGLTSPPNYNASLAEVVSVPNSMFTTRLFYNRPLWREIFGDATPPTDFPGFIAACERVREWGRERGRAIVPLAGSRLHAPRLMDRFIGTMTQGLVEEVSPKRHAFYAPVDVMRAFAEGKFALTDPELRAGLELMRELGRQMQPGFHQLQRDDAVFAFSQGRALMIASGSWDVGSLRQQARFEIGILPLPLPAPSHPRYGRHVRGTPSEAIDASTVAPFGLTKASAHAERAVDFLRFMTSVQGNQLFTQASGWLPAVVGVQPPEWARPFVPQIEGEIPGFHLNVGTETRRFNETQMHALLSAKDVDAYAAEVAPLYRAAARRDLATANKRTLLNVQAQDIALTALRLAGTWDDSASLRRKALELSEAQTLREASLYWSRHTGRAAGLERDF